MIRIDDLQFDYGSPGFSLQIPSLAFSRAEKAAIVGPSGSGKSTLLNLISGTTLPTIGSIRVGEMVVNQLTDAQRRRFRIAQVGFVFQDFELIEYLSVAENIRLPFWINRMLRWNADAQRRLIQLAATTGLSDKLGRRPDQLSRGERQRVAVCRALLTRPGILLADEPTASLDPKTGSEIVDLLIEYASAEQALLLLVTHDVGLQSRFDRVVDISCFNTVQSPAE
jgi:putative ABC transport system ATP-binding protein